MEEQWELAIERADKLEMIFNETCALCESDLDLARSVFLSKLGQYVAERDAQPSGCCFGRSQKQHVIVNRKKALEAAADYKGQHIAVLNFACARVPGGGGRKSGLTQEEAFCRETTLYPCISSKTCCEHFYEPNKTLSDLYSNALIYTPSVTVFRDHDLLPKVLPKEEWFSADVISMAAPNIIEHRPTDDALIGIFEDRFTRTMLAASAGGARVLILGAFGCGEFGNDPKIVATGAAKALEKNPELFDTVVFAIHEPGSKKKFHTFRAILSRYLDPAQFAK